MTGNMHLPRLSKPKLTVDQYHYTISLIKEGFRLELIDQGNILRIQEQIGVILKDLIFQYTRGESSSIKMIMVAFSIKITKNLQSMSLSFF